MTLTPDETIIWAFGPITLNATLVFTWGVMVALALAAWIAQLQTQRAKKWAMLLETIVVGVQEQIEQIAPGQSHRYLPFIATLFLFILSSALMSIVPGCRAPTASLSTTVALAIAVLIAVPAFSISASGPLAYLRQYAEPTIFMLPFNIIGELSRTVALAVRLYGNMMSGAVLAAILVSIAPFFFPVLMQGIGLLTGAIQAYIFAVLATVYIASAEAQRPHSTPSKETSNG